MKLLAIREKHGRQEARPICLYVYMGNFIVIRYLFWNYWNNWNWNNFWKILNWNNLSVVRRWSCQKKVILCQTVVAMVIEKKKFKTLFHRKAMAAKYCRLQHRLQLHILSVIAFAHFSGKRPFVLLFAETVTFL